jgi:hypothetical protein
MNDNTTAMMKLDDETLMTVAGGMRRVRAPKHRKYSVRQTNTQTFTAGDISLSVGGDLSGDVFIGNAASNSVGSEPA